MKRTKWMVLLVSLLPIMVAAANVSPPPRPLHKVGDHWTPYNPPTEFPEGAKVHIIKKGDTLWDLAKQYLGDPYLWPQIWERNPYIRDSHWIYPGDPVIVDIAVQKAPAAEKPVEEAVPTPPPPAPEAPGGEAIALGGSSDVYCFAILDEGNEQFPFSIVSAEAQPYQDDFSEGDIVYINGGTAEGVAAGSRFFILSPRGELDHPVSRDSMGTIYRQVGQLKVLCAQEHSSICEITMACDPVALGDPLKPYSPIPVPLAIKTQAKQRCDTPNGQPTGYVVYEKDRTENAGDNSLIMIDLGNADGAYPGQFATLYRDNPAPGLPRVVMGELGILTTGEHYSTAKVLSAWGPIKVGERVELR